MLFIILIRFWIDKCLMAVWHRWVTGIFRHQQTHSLTHNLKINVQKELKFNGHWLVVWCFWFEWKKCWCHHRRKRRVGMKRCTIISILPDLIYCYSNLTLFHSTNIHIKYHLLLLIKFNSKSETWCQCCHIEECECSVNIFLFHLGTSLDLSVGNPDPGSLIMNNARKE